MMCSSYTASRGTPPEKRTLPEGCLFYFNLIYDHIGIKKWLLRWADTSISHVHAKSYSLVSSPLPPPPLDPRLFSFLPGSCGSIISGFPHAILPCSKSFSGPCLMLTVESVLSALSSLSTDPMSFATSVSSKSGLEHHSYFLVKPQLSCSTHFMFFIDVCVKCLYK